MRNQKQCSQEKSSPSSINSFHGKRSSRKPSRPIRNNSFLVIKSFSRPTKTTLHSGKWAPSNEGTKKHPQTPNLPAQEMPFEWIWGITTKYLRRADRRNIRSFWSRHASSLSGSTTLGKKNKFYAITRHKSPGAEVLIVWLFFAFFSKKKKRKLLKVGCCETETTCIMDSSSTILLA